MASVKTKRLDEAKKQLQQNSFLILIGYDGEGVTTLGYDLLLDYPDRDQYIVMERKETLPCMTQTDDKQIIMFADDVFGTTYFDEKRYEGWCRNMNQIQKLMKHNGDILILALHTKFLKVGKCKSFCDHYQEHILNISELNLQLDFKERQRMLKCNIISQMEVLHIQVCKTEGQESVARINEDTGFIGTKISEQTIDDIARLSLASGFPRMVGNYLTSVDNVKKGVRYFTIPTKEMYEEIESFRMAKTKEDCDIYLALVAVFIYGKLNYDTFEIDCQYLAKSEKTLRTYLAKRTGRSQNFDQTTKLPAMINVLTGFAKKYECMPSLAGTVKRGISEMLGRYIKIKEHTRGHYVLASASVEKAVAVSCANVYPIDICKYSSKSVFRDITGPDHAFEKTEIHISVEEKDKSMCLAAMERLHLVVTSNKILEFIQHPAVRVAWFAKLFIKQLQKEKHALKAFVMKRDENSKASLLSLSLQYPYKSPRKFSSQCLTEDLMLSQKWPSIKRDYPEFAKENQQEYLEKCCEMGWTESYFRAVEKLELLPSKACLSLTVNSKHSENIHILKDVSRNKTLPMDDWYRALRQTCEKYVENDRDRMNMIRFIKKMVPFDYKSEAVESIIHTAGRKGDIILLSKVMSFYEDKDFTNQDGLTCLHLATQGNHLDFVKYALKNGVSQRVPDSKGELPIHYACRLGFIDIIELFVKQDTKVVHYMSHSKSTPLHLSAENAHFEITMFLVSNGAKLEANDINGRTPSYCAARYGTSIVLEYLLEKEMHNHLGNPALSVTCKNTRSPDEKPVLLRKRKILERKQNLLTTCLIDIVRENCHESDKKDEIMHMLNMGVNLNYVKEEVPPLLQLGIESECSVTMIEFLLNNGASASQRNLQTYDNALHKAVKNGNSDIVRLLLRDYTENKNLLWQRNKGNKTPLHTAVEKGYVELVELMKTESKTIKHAAKMGRCKTPLGLSEEKQRQLEDRFEWQKHEEVLI